MIKEIVFLPRKPGAPGNPPRQLVLECDGCHVVFERLYDSEFTKKARHFCSSECWYSTSRGPKGSRGAETITKPCGHCGKDVVRLTSQSHGKLDFFCSRSCVSEHKKKHQHPNAIEALKRTAADPEFRVFMSEHAKERLARDGHPMLRRKHSEESLKKMRGSHEGKHDGPLNGMYGRNHREDSKEKMSDGHSRNLVEGKGFVYGGSRHEKGWHTSSKGNDGQPMFYRSSWEKAMMLHLDADVNVVRYEYERVRIPYYDTDNHKRHYVPDFLIEHTDGSHILCEIKPKQFLDNEKTRLKADAANAWCSALKNYRYLIMTGEDLCNQGILT